MAKYTSSRSTSQRKSTSANRRGGKRSFSGTGAVNLTPDQKLDFIGGMIAVIGLLSLVAFFARENGSVTGWVAQLIGKIAGWGGFIIPVALAIGGLYLLLRNVERLPRLSGGRTAGVLLLYLNLLAWFHFAQGGGIQSAREGLGGGVIGAAFDSLLTHSLGKPGEVVVLVAWSLVAILFIVDVPLPKLLDTISGKNKPQVSHQKQISFTRERPIRSTTTAPARIVMEDIEEESTLPHGFNALDLNAEQNRPMPVKPLRMETPKPIVPTSTPASSSKNLGSTISLPVENKPLDMPTMKMGVNQKNIEKPWPIPSIADILDPATPTGIQTNYDKERSHIIEETLASFGAPSHVVEIHRGPAITQFGVEPDFIETRTGRTRVRVAKINSLADDLALALEAPSIRIQAPVPGKAYVGIEVPNIKLTLVSLRELLESESFNKLKSSLRFALGKDVAGKPVCADLTSMPHMLVAGTTNSGKSVLVNAILTSLLLNNSPADLRLLLVDPKRVELTGYNGIPHLLGPVVVEADKVVGALQWVLSEMDNRYKKFAKVAARNIVDYNRKGEEHLPYLVIVIDELADLMMLAPDQTERSITRLAQLARATGIHLILATQRPSVDVVTGLIKANFPARVAFMVASGMDSRVILDQAGAEKLLGKGDMLYQAPDAPAAVRLQGVYVSDPEIQRLVDAWKVIAMKHKLEGGVEPESMPLDLYTSSTPLKQGELFNGDERRRDELLDQALDIVRQERKASISMLQRKMAIGYTRAARIIDTLEEDGMIGPQQHGSQVRKVLDYGDVDVDLEMEDPEEDEDNV